MSEIFLFDEATFKQCPEKSRNIFIYEWLKRLDKAFEDKVWDKNEIKKNQKKIVSQIQAFYLLLPGPPIRSLIAKNIATLYEQGDILSLYDSIEYCNNILKSKEDSNVQKLAKLCSLNVLGCIYEKLGRMVGRSYEGTIQILIKCLSLKSNDVDIKIEILNAMEKITKGINTAGVSVYKEVYNKQLKSLLCDNSLDIRCASANVCIIKKLNSLMNLILFFLLKVLIEMTKHASFLYTSELDNILQVCFKALETTNSYCVRSYVSRLVGNLLFYAVLKNDDLLKNTPQQQQQQQVQQQQMPNLQNNDLAMERKLESAFSILSNGFSRNRTRFLKVNKKEESNSTSQTDQELRIGLTYSYVELIKLLGSSLLEKHLSTYINSILELIKNCKGLNTEIEIITLRKCVNYIFRSTIGLMLNERSQITAAKEIIFMIKKHIEMGTWRCFSLIDVFLFFCF